MPRTGWPLAGLAVGALGGALWGWLGGSGYESGDAALGTGVLCAVVGFLAGALAFVAAGRRDGSRTTGTAEIRAEAARVRRSGNTAPIMDLSRRLEINPPG